MGAGNHLGAFILDVVGGNMRAEQTHHGSKSRSWRLADGTAAFLTSWETLQKYGDGIDTTNQRVRKKNPTMSTIMRINRTAKDLAKNLKIQFGLLHSTCPIRGNEEITGVSGRVKIRMRISEDSESRRKLADLNQVPIDEHLDTALEEIGIWTTEFQHDESENEIPTNPYSGYIAMDQICRSSESHLSYTPIWGV